MKKKITVSVISELSTDQRVIRICTTLQEIGFQVHVIARELKNSLPLDNYSFSAERIKCFFRKGFLQYAEFNIKLFFKLLFCKTDYFLSNDLDTLVPNYIANRLRRKKIFYDSHEYFTGVPELLHRHFKRKIWKSFEDWIFPKLPVIYTVNDSIKNLYEKEYGLQNIGVIRNVPLTIPFTPKLFPDKWKGKIILLMQGSGIHPGRGGTELLQMMHYLPETYYLVFIGGGLQWNELKELIITQNLTERVEMIARVPPPELKAYTVLAHLGFSLDKPIAINYEFSLPNRLFDYIQAGIPVAAIPVVEVKKIIEEYQCGFCFTNTHPEQMAMEVMQLMNDKPKYEQMKQRTIAASKILNWENEQQKLIDIYRPYL
jgi:glycosyltransferase involved in cell wall biosynthesis